MDPELKQALIDLVKALTRVAEVITRKIEESE